MMATWPKNPDGTYLTRDAAKTFISVNGTQDIPPAPRTLQAQSGSRKVLVTWDLPAKKDDISGWKIYTGTENGLLDTVRDGSVRQYAVPASSGATPSTQNIFISSFNIAGIQSKKVQVQGTASVEASAPPDPTPPAGSPASGDTGVKGDADTGFSDAGFTR